MDTSDFGDVVWGKDVEADDIIESLFGSVSKKLKVCMNKQDVAVQLKKLGKKRKHIEHDKTATQANVQCSEPTDRFEIKKPKQDRNMKKEKEASVRQAKPLVVTEQNEAESSKKKTKQKKDKSKLHPQDSVQSKPTSEINKIPKKSRKNKYYHLVKVPSQKLNDEPQLGSGQHQTVTNAASKGFCSLVKKDLKKKCKISARLDGFDGRDQTPTCMTDGCKEDEYLNDMDKMPTVPQEKVKTKNTKNKLKVNRKSTIRKPAVIALAGTSMNSVSEDKNGRKLSRKRSNQDASDQVEDTKSNRSKESLDKANARRSSFNITSLRTVLSEQSAEHHNDGKILSDVKKKSNLPKCLKERMEEQLKSAHFRHLNEKLYTTTGSEAFTLFREDNEAFSIYHEGFQQQVNKWPANPLEQVIQYVKNSPVTHVVADFGCGDAKLAESVRQKVHSFDLVAVNPRVTACDMAHIPLAAESIDIGVFCLSLMGTNLLDYLLEAHRLLKLGGVLVITEVVSRFEKIGSFVRKLEKLGFILLNKDGSNKMFVWLEFKKAAGYDRDFLPKFLLQPCIYKRR